MADDSIRALSGATRLAGVIGDPVRHSLSPAILNAAFASAGLDWVFLAFPVPEGQAVAAVDAMRVLQLEGLSVTMPHKRDVIGGLDALTDRAKELEAVNCVYRTRDGLCGDSTDGPGFVDSLVLDEGFDPRGKRCVVVGAGGAGRAIVRALAEAGAADVAVVNRTHDAAVAAAALAGSVGRVADGSAVSDAELVVNATPLGMGVVVGTDGTREHLPVDVERLRPGQLVVDTVYDPVVTPLLAAAREAGAVAVGGVGMLIHQAAHAFRRWTGEEAPLEAMSAAALRELAGRAARDRGTRANSD